jgi:hypothetical protein
VSGTIEEFTDSPDVVSGVRRLPEGHDEIILFSKKRNPFNHCCLMFRKSAVERAGGYLPMLWFEDYYVCARALACGARGYNIPEPVMRFRMTADTMRRRGGLRYAAAMLRFRRAMRGTGYISFGEFLSVTIPHLIVCLIPSRLRAQVYRRFLRG